MSNRIMVSEWLINVFFMYLEQLLGLLWVICASIIGSASLFLDDVSDRRLVMFFSLICLGLGARLLARSKYAFQKAREDKCKQDKKPNP